MIVYQRDKVIVNHEYEFDIDAETGHIKPVTYILNKPNFNVDDEHLAHMAEFLVDLLVAMRAGTPADYFCDKLKIHPSQFDQIPHDKFNVIEAKNTQKYGCIYARDLTHGLCYDILLDTESLRKPVRVQIINKSEKPMKFYVHDLHANYLFITLCSELIFQASV